MWWKNLHAIFIIIFAILSEHIIWYYIQHVHDSSSLRLLDTFDNDFESEMTSDLVISLVCEKWLDFLAWRVTFNT